MQTEIIGKNVKRIRYGQELTQADVAKKAGISVPTYSKLESGKASPRIDTLYKVANAMGVRIQELLAQVRELKAVRFRAKKKLKRRDQVLAKAACWLDDFNYLLKAENAKVKYTLSNLLSSMIDISSAERPRLAAKKARGKMGLDDDEPIRDISGLFAANGIKLLTYPLASGNFYGMSIGESEGGPAIVVNVWDRISVERWIFSAAHELGHLLLHLNAYDVEVHSEDDQQEREANIFASYFLMPEKGFEKEWRETSGLSLWHRILKVKRIYHVSYQTVTYRLIESGFYDKNIWPRINLILRNEYNRDKIPKSFEPEQLKKYDFVNDWLDRVVRVAIEKEIITLSRASEILDISLQELRQRASYWAEENVAEEAGSTVHN